MVLPKITYSIKVLGYWNFAEDIPLLSSPHHPRNDPLRIKEELEVFAVWKRFNPSIPFEELRYEGRNIFTVKVNCFDLFGEKCFGRDVLRITIVLPSGYPYSFPKLADDPTSVDDDIFKKMIRKTTKYAVFMCVPKIEYIWWRKNRPRAGIAHYLNIFLIWYSIVAKNKRFHVVGNYYSEKSIFVK